MPPNNANSAPIPLRVMPPGRRLALARRDRLLTWLREMFIFLAFASYAGAFVPSLRNLRGLAHLQAGETDPFGTISQFAILAVVSLYLLRHADKLRSTIRPMAPYLAIVALCVVSALWSDYPFASVRRSASLLTCLGFGLFCHLELGLDGTITRLGRSMTLLIVMSLAAWVLVPSVGSETLFEYEGTLRGVFSTKNETGTAVEFAVGYNMYLLLRDRRLLRPVIRLVFLVGCLFLVRSSTAAMISLALICSGTIAYAWRSRLVLPLVFAFGSLGVALLALTVLDPTLPFALVGRNADMTGRAPLWQASLEAVARQPWLGYGYSGFWTADSRTVRQIWREIGWEAPSAHNGYIDVALQLGLVGLALFVGLWSRIIAGAIASLRRDGRPEALWILTMMMSDVMLNFSEGTMSYPDLFTVMMPSVIITLFSARQTHLARVAAGRRQLRLAPWQSLARDGARTTAADTASRGSIAS